MPRDLFGDVTRPSVSVGTRKWYTVPVSLFTHSLAVGLVIALPLLAPSVMPSVFANTDVTWTVPPPPPVPPPLIKIAERTPPANLDIPPSVIPDGITAEQPRPEAGFESELAYPGTIGGGIIDPAAIPAEPGVVKPVEQKPVQIGGTVRRPQKVRDVVPVYPPMAKAAGLQGVVIIEATLSTDGRVMNARVLRSVPLLDNAALDAVRQWEFTPTLLNGVAVPVVMTVTVSFVLSR
jgi:periplasmic protein TonB